jgi:hypothetical protein
MIIIVIDYMRITLRFYKIDDPQLEPKDHCNPQYNIPNLWRCV